MGIASINYSLQISLHEINWKDNYKGFLYESWTKFLNQNVDQGYSDSDLRRCRFHLLCQWRWQKFNTYRYNEIQHQYNEIQHRINEIQRRYNDIHHRYNEIQQRYNEKHYKSWK